VYLHDANVKGTFGAGSKARGVLGGACGLEGEPSRPTRRRDAFPEWLTLLIAAGTTKVKRRQEPWPVLRGWSRGCPKISTATAHQSQWCESAQTEPWRHQNHQSPAPMTRTLIEILSLDRRSDLWRDHLILKRTGTIKDNLSSGTSLGGAGIGWARPSMASVS
jgi:hypothetical protein